MVGGGGAALVVLLSLMLSSALSFFPTASCNACSAIRDLDQHQSVMQRRMEGQRSEYAFASDEEKFKEGT